MLPKPPEGMKLFLDVGRDQGRLDIPALIAAGVAGLYVRATDGVHDVDPQFEATAAACLASAMPFGCYGVLEPYGAARAEAQATHFVETVKGCGHCLPPWLDFELVKGLPSSEALGAAVVWRDAVAAALASTVVVYSGPSFFDTLVRLAGPAGAASVASLGTSPLAVAHYTQDHARPPRVPAPWKGWLFWQPSGGRKVSRNFATLPGRSIDVDVDFTRATLDELVAIGPGSVAG